MCVSCFQTKIAQLKDNQDVLELVCKEERAANQTLTRELKFHKKLQGEAEEAKREMYKLGKKLEDLRAVEEVVRGKMEDLRVVKFC